VVVFVLWRNTAARPCLMKTFLHMTCHGVHTWFLDHGLDPCIANKFLTAGVNGPLLLEVVHSGNVRGSNSCFSSNDIRAVVRVVSGVYPRDRLWKK